MLIPSIVFNGSYFNASLSRRVNANSQRAMQNNDDFDKLIKKGEC